MHSVAQQVNTHDPSKEGRRHTGGAAGIGGSRMRRVREIRRHPAMPRFRCARRSSPRRNSAPRELVVALGKASNESHNERACRGSLSAYNRSSSPQQQRWPTDTDASLRGRSGGNSPGRRTAARSFAPRHTVRRVRQRLPCVIAAARRSIGTEVAIWQSSRKAFTKTRTLCGRHEPGAASSSPTWMGHDRPRASSRRLSGCR